MKKQIVLFGLLLSCISCSIHVKAQTSLPIHLGIKAGGNLTNISSTENFEGKYSFGYQAGAMARLDLGSAYLQGETLFNKRKTSFEGESESSKLSWNSIDIPVTIGYKIVNTNEFNLRAFTGGLYSYSFGKEITGADDIKQAFSKFDQSSISLIAGLGFDIQRLSIDFSYENSLSNVSKNFKSKPKSFSIGIGYFLF
ncbi:porin family protein [Empedobacter falsenii]